MWTTRVIQPLPASVSPTLETRFASSPQLSGYSSESGHYPRHARAEVALHLVLPDPHDAPATAPKPREVCAVAGPVSLDLPTPEWRQVEGPQRISEAMPEVAVDEDRDSMLGKHDVWATGQRTVVLNESETEVAKRGTHRSLWSGIPPAHAGHAV